MNIVGQNGMIYDNLTSLELRNTKVFGQRENDIDANIFLGCYRSKQRVIEVIDEAITTCNNNLNTLYIMPQN